jgi:type I restriction enzyme S subunit
MGMTADEKSAFNQQINAIICNKNHDTDFIYYLLTYNRPILEKTAVKTTLPILNKGNFQDIKFLVPTLPEQRKIAHVLITVQKAIEQQDNLIRTTTELKKALMQKLFTEGTKGEPQKETEIGLVPESWEVKKLKDYSDLITKGSSPKWQGFNYCHEGLLFVRSQNIGWGVIENDFAYLPIEFNEIQKRSILKENDVLINLVGASIGRVAIAPKYFEGANSNQAVALVRLKKGNLKERFFMHFLLTNVGQTIIKSNEKAIARANISLNDISNFRIPIPTMEEQILISNYIDILEYKINILNMKKETLNTLFKTLLYELMTGQRRVHEMEFEDKKIVKSN